MPPLFSGVWRQGTTGEEVVAGQSWDEFQTTYLANAARGLRLLALGAYRDQGRRQWAGLFEKGDKGHYLWVDADWDAFARKYQELAAQGLRLVDFDTCLENGVRLWSGAWRAGDGPHYLHVDADWESFRAKYDELAGRNLRLIAFRTYRDPGGRRWAGAWRPGQGKHVFWLDADWNNFRAKYEELAARSLRLRALARYREGDRPLWTGVWEEGTGSHFVWVEADWSSFVAKHQELSSQGLGLRFLHVSQDEPARRLRLHLKILDQPALGIDTMLANLEEVYATADLGVEVASRQDLNLQHLIDLDVGACVQGLVTLEQQELFGHRAPAGVNDLVIYFVRSTVPPYNGCAAHPDGRPGAAVAHGASEWTLAHEIGHVLGLVHVSDSDRLMTGGSTSNITNPPPDLVEEEVRTMHRSPYVHG